MRSRVPKNTQQNGFTLVEIIITLLAAGILGTIFINLMGTALSASWNSVEMVRDEAEGVRIMEQIIADYVLEINTNPAGALAKLKLDGDGGVYGPKVSMQYVTFDSAGNIVGPVAPGDTLLVTVQVSAKNIINILTNSRVATDPLLRY
jgi:prepilin-type N-terminal cleavage/methylation domain-containing protein